ncbi:MAG: OmpH family outer membrane protein [Bacteroidetes bacterium]|nr:OmpH family outer membrane protein [Bacteroidota bacterium]
MKNISLALNAILLLAVGFLYYKDFSEKKSSAGNEETKNDSAKIVSPVQPIVNLSSLPKGLPVVFVNADSLFAKYEYAKKAKASGENRVDSYRKSYQQKAEAFQKDYSDYVEKAGKGAYSKEEATKIEEGLMKRRDEIAAMEQNQDKVMGELDNSTVDVQKKIYDYLARFNKEHGYYCAFAFTRTGGGVLGINDSLDVTRIVLNGLNTEYKSTKGK